jgi:hypothetical protein
MFTNTFWGPALERAIKSALQAFVTLASIGGVFDLATITWAATGWGTLSMFVLSLVTSLLSAGAGPTGSPSLVTDPNAAKGSTVL